MVAIMVVIIMVGIITLSLIPGTGIKLITTTIAGTGPLLCQTIWRKVITGIELQTGLEVDRLRLLVQLQELPTDHQQADHPHPHGHLTRHQPGKRHLHQLDSHQAIPPSHQGLALMVEAVAVVPWVEVIVVAVAQEAEVVVEEDANDIPHFIGE